MKLNVQSNLLNLFAFIVSTSIFMIIDTDTLKHTIELIQMLQDRQNLNNNLQTINFWERVINVLFASFSGIVVLFVVPMIRVFVKVKSEQFEKYLKSKK